MGATAGHARAWPRADPRHRRPGVKHGRERLRGRAQCKIPVVLGVVHIHKRHVGRGAKVQHVPHSNPIALGKKRINKNKINRQCSVPPPFTATTKNKKKKRNKRKQMIACMWD
jgi:hypothetical protein